MPHKAPVIQQWAARNAPPSLLCLRCSRPLCSKCLRWGVLGAGLGNREDVKGWVSRTNLGQLLNANLEEGGWCIARRHRDVGQCGVRPSWCGG